MKTKQIVLIGFISALALILSLLKVFSMPQGGSITLYLIPLYFAAFNFDKKSCIFVAIVTATLQIIFGGYILNPIQVILDYYLPILFITTCGIYGLNKYVSILIGSLLAMSSYVLSGMIFFEVPFIPSIIYNATFFIPTIIINGIIFIAINPKLTKAYQNIDKNV